MDWCGQLRKHEKKRAEIMTKWKSEMKKITEVSPKCWKIHAGSTRLLSALNALFIAAYESVHAVSF